MYTLVMNIPEETLEKLSSVNNLDKAMEGNGKDAMSIMITTMVSSMLQKKFQIAENNTIVLSEATFTNTDAQLQSIVQNTLRNLAAIVASQEMHQNKTDSCKSSEETQVETSQE